MSQPIYCPRCHQKNDADSLKCSFCGTTFSKNDTSLRTTKNVPTAAKLPETTSPCAERNVAIPPGGIGLLFEHDETIIRETNESFILGRYGQTAITSSAFIDLLPYGAVELGVSRNHARIYYENGRFVVEDLDSTNGSWLNKMQLAPGQNYPLQNNDQLTLGRLSVCICLGERPSPADPGAAFFLQEEAPTPDDAPYELSLAVLQHEVLPYLEALAFLQEAIDACAQRPSLPVRLLGIQATADSGISVRASGLTDAVYAVTDRLSPWRNLHQEAIGTEPQAADPGTQQSLVQLIAAILADHNPALSPHEKFEAVEKLSAKMAFLAFNPLTITSK